MLTLSRFNPRTDRRCKAFRMCWGSTALLFGGGLVQESRVGRISSASLQRHSRLLCQCSNTKPQGSYPTKTRKPKQRNPVSSNIQKDILPNQDMPPLRPQNNSQNIHMNAPPTSPHLTNHDNPRERFNPSPPPPKNNHNTTLGILQRLSRFSTVRSVGRNEHRHPCRSLAGSALWPCG